MILPTCSRAASTTRGWQWPVLVTPMPVVKSRYFLPSVPKIQLPSAWSTTTGVACLRAGLRRGRVDAVMRAMVDEKLHIVNNLQPRISRPHIVVP